MATPPRVFEDNGYYHIYNRGNHKQAIFLQDRDYQRFLIKLLEYKKKFPVRILAYCLMPNHFHLLIQQLTAGGITNLISNLSNSHSRYFNVKYETVGSLFQGRFKAKRVDKDEYLVHLSRYIHLNPVSFFSFLGKKAYEQLLRYQWSSLPTYLSGSESELVDPNLVLSYFSSTDYIADYLAFVLANVEAKSDPVVNHLVFDG